MADPRRRGDAAGPVVAAAGEGGRGDVNRGGGGGGGEARRRRLPEAGAAGRGPAVWVQGRFLGRGRGGGGCPEEEEGGVWGCCGQAR